MKDAKDVLTLTIMLGFGLAIILNADQSTAVLRSISSAWFGLLRTVSGTSSTQVFPSQR